MSRSYFIVKTLKGYIENAIEGKFTNNQEAAQRFVHWSAAQSIMCKLIQAGVIIGSLRTYQGPEIIQCELPETKREDKKVSPLHLPVTENPMNSYIENWTKVKDIPDQYKCHGMGGLELRGGVDYLIYRDEVGIQCGRSKPGNILNIALAGDIPLDYYNEAYIISVQGYFKLQMKLLSKFKTTEEENEKTEKLNNSLWSLVGKMIIHVDKQYLEMFSSEINKFLNIDNKKYIIRFSTRGTYPKQSKSYHYYKNGKFVNNENDAELLTFEDAKYISGCYNTNTIIDTTTGESVR